MTAALCPQCSHSPHEGYCGTTCWPCFVRSAASASDSRLARLDDLRNSVEDFAETFLPLGDAQMLVKSAAEKLAMACDLIEAERG